MTMSFLRVCMVIKAIINSIVATHSEEIVGIVVAIRRVKILPVIQNRDRVSFLKGCDY